ncbi:YuzL family protein [Sutcliffiella deserti]|nr:YuzL family protein [Sutcliffiella deserti]
MSKPRKKPGSVGLSSPELEGQGTTSYSKVDGSPRDSSRKSTKRS